MRIDQLMLNRAGSLDEFVPDVPDVPDPSAATNTNSSSSTGGLVDFGGLVESFRNTSGALDNAAKAENAFLQGHGNMLEMVFERVKADTLLQVDQAFASKVTQSVSTLMNLQV